MTTFPGSPRQIRGGLVLLDPVTGAVLRVIALQYNPDTLSRTLQAKGTGQPDNGDRSEALRLKGPAVETIKFDAEIDATDQLERAEATTVDVGIQPQLAALETIVHPRSAQLRANQALAAAGELEIIPMQAPLVLFVWSKTRVIPVRITEFSITEEAFDPALNPIRAKVSLGLRVLSVDDLGFGARGGSLYLGYLAQKEQLASRAAGAALSTLGLTGIP